jgi:tetratricopeptide (TPR) repeat protein
VLGGKAGAVLIDPINGPAHMAERGFGDGGFNRALQKEIDRIYFIAGADYVGAEVQATTDEVEISVEGTGISLTDMKVMLFRRLGWIRTEFSGQVVERDGDLVLLLVGQSSDGHRLLSSHSAGLDQSDALVRDAARDIVNSVDPYEAAKLQFETDEINGDFSQSLDMISALFPRMQPAEDHYLYDLAGRALALSALPDDAMTAYRRAIQADLLYQQGKDEEARRYDQVALQIDPKFYLFFLK